MSIKEPMKQAGYKYVGMSAPREHVLQPIDGRPAEIWFSNKDHASYGIVFKNTHLEFARTASEREVNVAATIDSD